jgi:hypothetical protein
MCQRSGPFPTCPFCFLLPCPHSLPIQPSTCGKENIRFRLRSSGFRTE